MAVDLILNLGAANTGLALTGKVYTGATLAGSPSADESPASSGRYVASFDAAANTSYDWVFVDGGGVSYGEGSFHTGGDAAEVVGPVPGYEGRYTTYAKLVQFLGQYGVDVDTDVDGDGTADAGAVQQGIVTAEGTVDFRAGGPFTVTPGSVGEAMLEKWSRYLAAVEIAQKRLGVDAVAVQGLRTLRQEAYDEMKMYRDGLLPLPGATGPTDSSGILAGQESLAPAAGCPCDVPPPCERRTCWN